MKAIKMRRLVAASAAMVVATVVPASAGEVSTLDLDAICRGIAAHATSLGEADDPTFHLGNVSIKKIEFETD
jgi:hypothetical protein